MSALPAAVPPRIEPLAPGAVVPRLARRGARAFRVRAADPFGAGDLWVTLPEVAGPAVVLVPRGFGWPRPARRAAGGWRSEPAGEACSPARWDSAGGVAAWVREGVGGGPVDRAERGVTVRDAGATASLVVSPRHLAWAAARREAPEVARGVVLVGERVVRGASPAARARGVTMGQSMAEARRRCPRATVVAPPELEPAWARLEARLRATGAEVRRERGGFVLAWPADAADPGADMDRLERLGRWIWQSEGVEVALAQAATPRAARAVAAALEAGQVALVPGQATAAWEGAAAAPARVRAGRRSAGWSGAALVDVESVVATARALGRRLDTAAAGAALRVRVTRAGGPVEATVVVPAHAGAELVGGLVEAALRGRGPAVAGATAVEVRVVGRGEAGAVATVAPPPAAPLARFLAAR